jgi:diguanylate cyclase
MKYPEPKEQTVALLRQVLAQVGQHDAALNPLTFTVFYEYVAGINLRLSAAMERALLVTPRLSDATVRELFRDFAADVGVEESERIQRGIQRAMASIVESATRTGQAVGAFGEQLDGLSGALAGQDSASLAPHIDSARAGTSNMRKSVKDLELQVAMSNKEIDLLRADLLRTRSEATLCPLTRLLNRRGFEESLDAMLRQRPLKGSLHCLVMLDIDHFKRVNDTHGHPVGDRVLEGFGQVLRSVPAEPGMACARYGGEEFAILLPAVTMNKAVQVAETVCARTRAVRFRSRTTNQVQLTVTVSAGVAAWRPGEDAKSLLACADAALYRSKEDGRDRVTVA